MMIDSTDAKIGRWIKKRENIVPSSMRRIRVVGRLEARSVRRPWRIRFPKKSEAASRGTPGENPQGEESDPLRQPGVEQAPRGSRSITVKNTGVRKMPNMVTPSMPLKTASQGAAHLGPGAVRDQQGNHAQDEGEGGHHDRPQAELASVQGGFAARSSALAAVLGELHDEDGVFAGQPDQHHEPDLVKILMSWGR